MQESPSRTFLQNSGHIFPRLSMLHLLSVQGAFLATLKMIRRVRLPVCLTGLSLQGSEGEWAAAPSGTLLTGVKPRAAERTQALVRQPSPETPLPIPASSIPPPVGPEQRDDGGDNGQPGTGRRDLPPESHRPRGRFSLDPWDSLAASETNRPCSSSIINLAAWLTQGLGLAERWRMTSRRVVENRCSV
jgi:hypothetical protein